LPIKKGGDSSPMFRITERNMVIPQYIFKKMLFEND
jgi:hypothetical protein